MRFNPLYLLAHYVIAHIWSTPQVISQFWWSFKEEPLWAKLSVPLIVALLAGFIWISIRMN